MNKNTTSKKAMQNTTAPEAKETTMDSTLGTTPKAQMDSNTSANGKTDLSGTFQTPVQIGLNMLALPYIWINPRYWAENRIEPNDVYRIDIANGKSVGMFPGNTILWLRKGVTKKDLKPGDIVLVKKSNGMAILTRFRCADDAPGYPVKLEDSMRVLDSGKKVHSILGKVVASATGY
jgi:hypothetical protein